MTSAAIPLDSFSTFGGLLKYLRRRARLTQRELSIAVKYSEAQISRLEQNQRPPDLSALAALFIPALYIEDEPETIARLIELATQARGQPLPEAGSMIFSRSTREQIVETLEARFPSTNLPLSVNSFIGRAGEVSEIRGWLRSPQARLVTVTGTGGCGKTRLAMETARELVQVYRDGAWMIELASITNPLFIAQAVIAALEAPEPRDGTPAASLIKYLRTKHLLLILDNCEQVIAGTAQLVEEILRACPSVQILATSREALNIPGESVLRLQPLSLPGENPAGESDATQLFFDRAHSILPGFALEAGNASYVAQICRQLDGIPLAIELAVSRLRVLSVQQIAARLDDRFGLLTTGGRTALPRQQTLRAAIDWSYDLLSAEDQRQFRRFCVFSGGFGLKAAQAVIDATSGSNEALDVITRFVEKSLITVDRLPNEETRYRLLETVREYCREKLEEKKEALEVRRRHFHFFLAFAEEANRGLQGKDHVHWKKRLEHEHENLRAALEFATIEGSPALAQLGLRLASTLSYFWFLRGYHEESHDWLEKLRQNPQLPRSTAEYTYLLCVRAHWMANVEEAHHLFEEGISLSYALNDARIIAETHQSRATFGWLEVDPSTALGHFQQSLVYSRRAGDRWLTARTLAELGEFAQVRLDDRITARKSFEESLQIARELEDIRGIAFALVHLGDLTIEQNKLDETRAYSSEGLVVAGELNDMESMSWGLDNLGIVAMSEGRFAEAERLCMESLMLSQELGNDWHTIIRRHWLGRVFYFKGDEDRAIELYTENHIESQKVNFDWGYGASLHELGCAALRSGNLEKAKSFLTESIQVLHNGHYGYSLTYSLDAVAALALAQGQPERAQVLLAAAEAYRRSIHTDLLPPEQVEHEELLNRVRSILTPEKISSLTEHGRAMSHDEAVELAQN